MKTLKYIAASFLMASTLLSSCTLLCSSPIPHSSSHNHYYGPWSSHYGGSMKIYNGLFQVPAEGGVYKFNCADDQFYISRVFDSSMPIPEPHRHHGFHSGCSCCLSAINYRTVEDLDYDGTFYTITCNQDEHNWIITVDPLSTTAGESDMREIWVSMWDDSDDSYIVFLFEQSDGPLVGIE